MSDRMQMVRTQLYEAEAKLQVLTLELGDQIGERAGRGHTGMDAIIVHLVQKHGWLPSDIRAITPEDLRLVLADEFEAYRPTVR